ncbi:MAG: hypothetical protein ACRC7N_18960 [Clostridium sp.]
MSYLDVKKRIMKNKGENELEARKNHTKRYIINNFKNDPSYKRAILIKPNMLKEDIDIRVTNVDKSTLEKNIYLLPDKEVEIGSLIEYPKKTYIVMEFEENLLSPRCKALECFQTLNWHGLDKPVPCYATNSSYGTKGIVETSYLNLYEAKVLFYLPYNETTSIIKQDMRFIFNNDKDSVYKVVDKSRVTTGKVLRLVMDKIAFDETRDDSANNVAYNEFLMRDYVNEPPGNINNIQTSSGGLDINKYGAKTFNICCGDIPTKDAWEISIDYNGVPHNHIEVIEKTYSAIRIKNLLGHHDNKIKIIYSKNNETLEAEVDLVK